MSGRSKPFDPGHPAAGAHTDLRGRLDYKTYLRLDRLLSAQEPLSCASPSPPECRLWTAGAVAAEVLQIQVVAPVPLGIA